MDNATRIMNEVIKRRTLDELQDIGLEIEATHYNSKFVGQGGITSKGLSDERKNLKAKAKRRLNKLAELGVDIQDESDKDEDLEYALQFI